MKAIIYARVSSRDQEETGYSLPAQEKLLLDYASRRSMEVVRVFAISESASGAKQREVFTEMMRMVAQSGIAAIVCEKVDRLTRNFKDALAIDEWIEADAERQVHMVKDGIVLHKGSRSNEKLNWGIRLLFAKNYIDNLREEVKKGLQEKLAQGWLPSRPKLGYRTEGEEGHKIHVIDEVLSPFIRRAFELYATGTYSLERLADVLYEEGLRTRGGHRLVKARLASILRDPFYIGRIHYNGSTYPGKHEPLVSPELFYQVEGVMTRKNTPRYRKHETLFRGLIRCGTCNATVTWERQKGHWYGHCGKWRACGERKFIREEALLEQLLPHLDRVAVKDADFLAWLKDALKESHGDMMAYRENAIRELERRSAELRRRRDVIYDDKVAGIITPERWEAKDKELGEELDLVDINLRSQTQATGKYFDLGVLLLELAHNARALVERPTTTLAQRRELISLFFSEITLSSRFASVKYTPGFEILSRFVPAWNDNFEPSKLPMDKRESSALGAACLTWLPGWDEFRTALAQDLFAPEMVQRMRGLLVPGVVA